MEEDETLRQINETTTNIRQQEGQYVTIISEGTSQVTSHIHEASNTDPQGASNEDAHMDVDDTQRDTDQDMEQTNEENPLTKSQT